MKATQHNKAQDTFVNDAKRYQERTIRTGRVKAAKWFRVTVDSGVIHCATCRVMTNIQTTSLCARLMYCKRVWNYKQHVFMHVVHATTQGAI